MNLEKIKELEDLKSESRKYGIQYQSLVDEKRHMHIVNAHNDFVNFFKGKGFSITEKANEIQAIYGNSKIKIDKFTEEESWGFYAVWEMECQINKSKYRIVLDELGHHPSMKTTFGKPKVLTEDEKLNKDIEETKERIEKRKKEIDEFSTVKLGYGLINEEDKITNNKYPQFESMKALLENIFE